MHFGMKKHFEKQPQPHSQTGLILNWSRPRVNLSGMLRFYNYDYYNTINFNTQYKV
jgi:hypothetical protein